MEKIRQFLSKRNLYIANIVLGITTVVLIIMTFLVINSLSNIKSLLGFSGSMSTLRTFCYIYYLNFIILLVLIVGYSIRLFKMNDKTMETKILLGGNSAALLLCLISISLVASLMSLTGGMFGISSSFGLAGFESKIVIIGFMLFIQLFVSAYAAFLFIKKKDSTQDEIASLSSQNESSDTHTNAETKTELKGPPLMDKFKTYYATSKGKKNIFIAVSAAGLIIIAIIALMVFNSMKRTPIDLTKNCDITYEGVSGAGMAKAACTPDYNLNDKEVSLFVKSINYEVKENGALKNGDTIEIAATYSEKTAESLKLTPENTTKKFEVEGLEVVYLKFEDIPKEVSDTFEPATKPALDAQLMKNVGTIFGPKALTIDKSECIATYYEYTDFNKSGTAYYIYRAEVTEQNSVSSKKQIYYYNVSIKNVKPDKVMDLALNSEDLKCTPVLYYEKEMTDKKLLTDFKKAHKDLEVIKESPSN